MSDSPFRLPRHVLPTHYDIRLEPDLETLRFDGSVGIDIDITTPTDTIVLNTADIDIKSAGLVSASGSIAVTEMSYDEEYERVTLVLETTATPGSYRLEIEHSGIINDQLRGLYKSVYRDAEGNEHTIAASQCQTTDARRVFPCWDEPDFKATFQTTMVIASDLAVYTNTRELKRQSLDDGRIEVSFANTMKMSPYLLAFMVGPFEATEPVDVRGTPIRIIVPKGNVHLTDVALKNAIFCFEYLTDYYGIPYPGDKLDHIAIPDFAAGAMENVGLITYRDAYLVIDEDKASQAELQNSLDVVGHEVAHQWFGNLVTMAWWDDLWLNEAFATWMAFHIVDGWKPEWKMWHDFQHGRAAALELDSLRHTHPIYCRVRTPADANQNFDLITYEKGASVVRMLERYLGPAAFRRGVRRYIRRHREGNTVAADLWRALTKASGVEVEPIARAWIEREGYPLIEVRRVRSGGRTQLWLRQERFQLRPQRPPLRSRRTRPAPPWPVPWVARLGPRRLERRLLTHTRERIDLRTPEPRFVYGNADEGGFFRPLHDPSEMRTLVASLSSLAAVERMGLVDHQWALVRARRARIGTVLDLAEALAEEADPDVLVALHKPLAFIAHSLIPSVTPESAVSFRNWLVAQFGPAFKSLGWHPARNEPDEVRLRRAILLALVGSVAGSESVIASAEIRCDRYLVDRRSLDANLADTVVALAARAGGEQRYRRFTTAMTRARSPQEKRRFLLALADFRGRRCVDRTLAMSLTERIPTQDLIFVLARLLANPAARQRCWAFIQKRWSALRRRMPPLLASRLIEATTPLLEPRYRREIAAFFRDHPLPGGERALRQTLERFDWYRGFRREAAADLEARLDS